MSDGADSQLETRSYSTSQLETLAAYADATRALRDAELALRSAQERYRLALGELNRALAPVPEATG